MRLSRVKLAGFKSFVDPTSVPFPSNLTGVVGPNGCGKSNIIDAVRWVMGELSARHLRGDSMADVIFNGSGTRRPVGTASVELIFDNSDGKLGGNYATYAEVSLKRVVSRDGTSAYFINGARCRRKDITTLFLGTGLGSRSYAIIEQGMISRVIEARSDDMRAFIEEAAGISRYKERRRETEARITDTRENLERLQDVRDEVDKQIRHLQRQAAQARRFQELKNRERQLSAEVLALRLREIDSGAAINNRAMREADLVLQQQVASQRAAEAAVEKQREFQFAASERVNTVQGGYYQQGAEVARCEQQLTHARELRERRQQELTQTRSMLADVASGLTRDQTLAERLRAEIAELMPSAAAAQEAEGQRLAAREEAEAQLQQWQERWEQFNRELGGTYQTTQVERARIEQLDDQLRRLGAHRDRLAVELDQLIGQNAAEALAELEQVEQSARGASEQAFSALQRMLEDLQRLRETQQQVERELEAARHAREAARAELVSLDALQKAALGEADRDAGRWLAATGLAERPRVTAQLEVESGWERSVEAVLGETLEAVSVPSIDAVAGRIGELTGGQVMLVEEGTQQGDGQGLAARVRGPRAVLRRLERVGTVASLEEALARRGALADGESLVTDQGVWVGRDWLRVARGGDPHAGVIEREHRIRGLRGQLKQREQTVSEVEQRLQASRADLAQAEAQRDELQRQIQSTHTGHSEARSALEAMRARSQQSALRLERIERESAEVQQESTRTQQAVARARDALEEATGRLERLEAQRAVLEDERDERRAASTQARELASAAQTRARDVLIQLEGRKSTEASLAATLQRMHEQHEQLAQRQQQLDRELADGDAPIEQLSRQLNELLERRLEIEADLQAARRDLESADAELRGLDERRIEVERRVEEARQALEAARLAAQETRLRRESLLEQFALTRFDLEEVLLLLPAEARIVEREDQLLATQTDLQRLGQVN
ncbi:MAG: chromosome segregation protein SMC, partial [Nevskiaceae bacterium]|nr:chromosome segregation protein SMC [Nevskiaceae bacterium]